MPARLSRPPGWPGLLAGLAIAGAVGAVAAAAPLVVLTIAHHDIFIPMDAAWRTLNGQWPHRDYYTPIGVAYAWLHGAAALLWGLDARVADHASLLALPLVVGPALLVATRRLNLLSTLLLSLMLALLVVSPVFIDGPTTLVGHLASYNRIGGGLAAVACLWAMRPAQRPSGALDVAEIAVIAGLLLVLLLLKVTFFLLAGGLVTVAVVAGLLPWRHAAVVAVLGLFGLVCMEALMPGLLPGYLADLRRAGAANGHLFRVFYTLSAVVLSLPLLLLIGLLLFLGRPTRPAGWRPLAAVWAGAGACVLVSTQNFGAFSPPLAMLALVVAQWLPGRPVIGLAGALLATAPFAATQGLGTLAQLHPDLAGGSRIGGSPRLDTLVWMPNPSVPATLTVTDVLDGKVVPDAELEPAEAALVLTDGLALLSRLPGVDMKGEPPRIAVLSFSNPFPAALGTPPPRGVALWWDEDRTFRAGHVSPAEILGDATVVMEPAVWWNMAIVQALRDGARPVLERGFTPVRSRYWTAWVKTPS